MARLARRLRDARARIAGSSHAAIAGRMAGTAFLIRVASAGILFVSQILLARWMGSHEFGIYVYVWTWVVMLGAITNLGLGTAAQRFVPQYAERGEADRLRGFIHGGRWIAFGLGTGVAGLGLLAVWLLSPFLDTYLLVPLALATVCIPLVAVADIQDGIARSYNWADIALVPSYVLRPLAILVAMGAAHVAGLPTTAIAVILVAVAATWTVTLLQLVALNRRLRPKLPAGPRHTAPREWFAVALPVFMVESFYVLLTYTDILVLERYHPPEDIAIYYAAIKVLALVAFVHYAVAAAAAHRFAEYHVAGDAARLAAFLGQTIRWTFWASLAAVVVVLALGKPFLWLFGPGFVAGYPVMFVFAIGLMARAAVGPVERFLVMVGAQNLCAVAYAGAFVVNLALNLLLVPKFGLIGAASATAIALVLESIALFVIARGKLPLRRFIWWPPRATGHA